MDADIERPTTIIRKLVELYKQTPTQVKRTLDADPNNVYGQAWKDALDYLKAYDRK